MAIFFSLGTYVLRNTVSITLGSPMSQYYIYSPDYMYKCKSGQYSLVHIPYPAIPKCVSTHHILDKLSTVRTSKNKKVKQEKSFKAGGDTLYQTLHTRLAHSFPRVIHRFFHSRTKIEQKNRQKSLTFKRGFAILETVNKTDGSLQSDKRKSTNAIQ